MRRGLFIGWYAVKDKIFWMIIVMFFPEFPLGLAIHSLINGRKFTAKFRSAQLRDGFEGEIEWTLTHTMYADMGGFVVKFPRADVDASETSSSEKSPGDNIDEYLDKFRRANEKGHRYVGPFDWDPHPGHYALAKASISARGLGKDSNQDQCARALSGNGWALNAHQILQVRQCGIIDKFPAITETEINDKNKGDIITKLLALVQVVWLCIQLIIRAAEGRQSSQIEITALALAVCAFVTYLLLMWQPKDIYTPTVISAQRSPTQAEFDSLVTRTDDQFWVGRDNYSLQTFIRPRAESGEYDLMGIMIGIAIFGSVHLAAWNFEFPSMTEQLLWRISGLSVALLPLVLMLLFAALSSVKSGWLAGVVFILGVDFVLARLFLLVEAFRSTYYLPPPTYIATSASNIPHIG